MHNPLTERRAGVLLHPTSLPGGRTHGDLGRQSLHFIDFLAACGFGVWQTLPLGPTHVDGSPYQCLSVHAGNEDLISLDDLVSRGWLDAADSTDPLAGLTRAWNGFSKRAGKDDQQAYLDFKEQQAGWLDEYALYRAIRHVQGGSPWHEWPASLRDRNPAVLGRFRKSHAVQLEQVRFEQFLFFTQWHVVRGYANKRGVALYGDIPIYVAHDSTDVWAHRKLFSTDSHGRLETVAGVPPDYFSATGQRWGNPLYRWDRIVAEDFQWWLERFRTQLDLFDIIRLDHFRGFEQYWEIPATAATAMEGHWVEAPGAALFNRLAEEFGPLPLVAEDLGIITPEVEALRERTGMPGMKILQFAFDGGPDNPYLPENHEPNSVVYTGTHDNDTTLGWFEGLDKSSKRRVYAALGDPPEPMPWALIHAALASRSRLAIFPMQDILALDSQHRMNTPGTTDRNWCWRFTWEQVPEELTRQMRELLRRYERCHIEQHARAGTDDSG